MLIYLIEFYRNKVNIYKKKKIMKMKIKSCWFLKWKSSIKFDYILFVLDVDVIFLFVFWNLVGSWEFFWLCGFEWFRELMGFGCGNCRLINVS